MPDLSRRQHVDAIALDAKEVIATAPGIPEATDDAICAPYLLRLLLTDPAGTDAASEARLFSLLNGHIVAKRRNETSARRVRSGRG